MKKEVDTLVKIGVLKKSKKSQWAALTFMRPKINGTVSHISDFRELNNIIKTKPFPIPNIQLLLLKLEGFRYTISLDLAVGYYHMTL